VNLVTALELTEAEAAADRNPLTGSQTVLKTIPAGSLIFGADQQLNYLQLVGDYHLCDLTQFDPKQVALYSAVDPTVVTAGLQPQRALEIYDRVKGLGAAQMGRELISEQNQVMTDALAQGQHVYFVMPVGRRAEITRLLPRNSFVSTVVTNWDEPGDFATTAVKPRWLGITRANVPIAARHATIVWQITEVKAVPPPKPKVVKPRIATTRPVKK